MLLFGNNHSKVGEQIILVFCIETINRPDYLFLMNSSKFVLHRNRL